MSTLRKAHTNPITTTLELPWTANLVTRATAPKNPTSSAATKTAVLAFDHTQEFMIISLQKLACRSEQPQALAYLQRWSSIQQKKGDVNCFHDDADAVDGGDQ